MTLPPKNNIQAAAIGAVLTLAGTLALTILTGAWSGKESSADHNTDIHAVRADIRRVLDVVCTDHPNAPQCNQPPQP